VEETSRGTKDLNVIRRVWRRGWDLNPRDPMDHRLTVVGDSRHELPVIWNLLPTRFPANALGDPGTTNRIAFNMFFSLFETSEFSLILAPHFRIHATWHQNPLSLGYKTVIHLQHLLGRNKGFRYCYGFSFLGENRNCVADFDSRIQ